jgi:hypothetical protein
LGHDTEHKAGHARQYRDKKQRGHAVHSASAEQAEHDDKTSGDADQTY